jgi:pyruvate kinase
MIEQNARKTKIIKSYDVKSITADEARQVAQEAVDVIRLVYRPEAIATLKQFMNAVRVARPGATALPIMLDCATWVQASTAGAKPFDVAFGDKLTCTPVGRGGKLEVKTDDWKSLFAVHASVFLGTGSVAFKVLKVEGESAELEVILGGTVFPETDVSVPSTRGASARQRIEVSELAPLLQEGVDYILIPGEWDTKRIHDFRLKLAADYGERTPWLIAKVDSKPIYENLKSLLGVVDGVVISRRELAFSINPALVPMMTKEIIQLANEHAKLVVTASEMLASMRRNPTPTRAEVSDVANAVLDGTDAVVLSEEVANGKYGPQAVAVVHKIIQDIEAREHVAPNWIKKVPAVENEMDAIAYHAYRTAQRIQAKALVCITKSGNTALKLASFQPPIPIIAVTFSPDVARRLSLIRGVSALTLTIDPNIDEVLPLVNDQLVRGSWLKPGDPIIFASVTLSSIGRESSNLFTVQILN